MKKSEDKEVLDLLKVWYFIKTYDILWPEAISALENRINELLELKQTEQWQATTLNAVNKPTPQ